MLLASLLPQSVRALQAMTDEDMSAVAGGDGITVVLQGDTLMQADALQWVTDDGGLDDHSCAGGALGQHACTRLDNLRVTGVGGPARIQVDIDAGTVGAAPYLSVESSWSPQRLVLGGITFQTPSLDATSRSLGAFALQSEGSLVWRNRAGLFNDGGQFASLSLSSLNDLIYRQGPAGEAELSLADMVFDLAFTTGAASAHAPGLGRIAIANNGIEIGAEHARVDLQFDLAFKANPVDFDTAGRQRMLHMGWQGGLTNALLRIGAGGLGYGSYLLGGSTFQDYDGSQTGVRSQGINLLSEWDFDSDFSLVIGEAGGNGTYARLGNWQRLGAGSDPMFSFPLLFDVVQGGVGPAGLCAGPFSAGVPNQASCTGAGGEWLPSGPPGVGDAAFAVLLRDGQLRAYSSRIEVVDPLAGGAVSPVDWGIMLTYGKLDADIFLRPEGRGDGVSVATTDTGIRADINLLAQSPDAWRRANSSDASVRASAGDNWQANTHVMTVDSAAGQAVGFVNGDIMWNVRDLYLRVTDGDTAWPDLPGGLWLQTDTHAGYRFRGIFGGGSVNDLSYDALTKVSLVDVNLSTNRFIFVLNPLPVGTGGEAPIGFNGLLDFDGSAYMRFGEVSSPQSTFFVDQVSGRIAWRDGSLALISGQNTSDGLPQMSLTNTLDIGQSAHFGGPAGDPLVGRIGFGTEDFGRLAIPAGTWHSEVTLKIPN